MRHAEPGPRLVSPAAFATSETVEGARLSPSGAEIALVTSRLKPSLDSTAGERNSLVEIWSIEKAKKVGELELSSVRYSLRTGIPQPEMRVGERFIRYASDGKLLVVYNGEDLRVLESSSTALPAHRNESVSVELHEALRINLELGLPGRNTLVQSMEITRDGSRAALGICNPREGSAETIRVYDLASGSILQQWKFETGCVFSGYSPLSWDPQGARLAVSLPEHGGGSPHPLFFIRGKAHLYVLDVKSGKTLRDINTGYTAGPVCFTKNDTVLTASLNADSKYFREDTIREWNVTTGHLVREMEEPSQGVHSLLALSEDGNSVLGYTGREKPVEHFLENVYLEFSIWDYRTGKLIGTSGRIDRPQSPDSLDKHIGPIASFGSSNDRMTLPEAGNKVLVWWQQSSRPFLVYNLALHD